VWLLFIAGFLTGLHCLSMCGNLVIGYSLRRSKNLNLTNHLIYNSFRLLSYTLVGFLLGLLGKGLNLAAYGETASLAAGVFMLFLGFKLLGLVKPLNLSSFSPLTFLKNKFLQLTEKTRKLGQKNNFRYFPEAAFGSLSGFMPCAPLQAAQLYAAGTGSPFLGALSMLIFGLGTFPWLLSYGALAGKLSLSLKNRLATLSALLIIVLGLVVLNRGLTLNGSPLSAAQLKGLALRFFHLDTVSKKSQAEIKIQRAQYFPSTLRVEEGRPIKLKIFRQENNPCSNEIVFPQIGLRKVLKPFEETEIEIPPLKAGVYQFTCQMGMMSGTLIVEEKIKEEQ